MAEQGAAKERPPLGARVRVVDGKWRGRVGMVTKRPPMFLEYVYAKLDATRRAKERVEFLHVDNIEPESSSSAPVPTTTTKGA